MRRIIGKIEFFYKDKKMKQAKLHYFTLTEEEQSTLYEYFYTHHKPSCHRRDKSNVVYNRVSDIADNIYDDAAIGIALRHLNAFGFTTAPLHKLNYLIEVCRYSCKPTDFSPLSEFDIHEDDNAVIDYTVNTVVFYLHKSPGVIGGNLLVEISRKRTTIPIFSGTAVAFRGDMYHMPTPCLGEGLRDTIVVQLERTEYPS
jgi:hypothetical protein